LHQVDSVLPADGRRPARLDLIIPKTNTKKWYRKGCRHRANPCSRDGGHRRKQWLRAGKLSV